MQGSSKDKLGNDEQRAASESVVPFKISKKELSELINTYQTRKFEEDIVASEAHGGVEGLAEKICVDPKFGLTGEDFPLRTQHFGNNYRPPLIAKTWLKLFWAALDDFMLKVLIFASIFSIVFDMILASPDHRSHAWIEGAAIMIAVMLVAGVGSFVDWKKEVQFVKSRAKSEEKNVCCVLRSGEVVVIHHNFLHVGDIINVEYGMAVPVDGIVLQAT